MKKTVVSRRLPLLGASLFSLTSVATDERPNIVIILTDDSGYTDPGCYGGEIDTPNIDRLGYNGMRFSNFYNNGRCSPTRASLLTGRDSAHAGFAAGTLGGWKRELNKPAYRARLSAELPTIAELLKADGYQTMMVGKWHLGGSTMKKNSAEQAIWKRLHPGWELTQEEMDADWNAMPLQRGFDHFFGMLGGEGPFFFLRGDRHDYLDGNDPTELRFEQTYTIESAEPRQKAGPFVHQGKTAQAFYDTDGLTDRAVDMLREAEADRPFFMYVAYRAPHLPLHAPKELVDKYLPRYADVGKVEKNRIEGLIRQELFPDGAPYSMRFQNEPPVSGEWVRDSLQHRLAVYAAMMEDVDRNVGRLIQSLEESGRLDNTLIFFLSDNGAAGSAGQLLNKPYLGVKAQVWEGGTKTHCIAHWPAKIKAGGITDMIGWVGDLLPTALELAGISSSAEFDGRSILPALLGKTMPPPEYLFFNDRGQQSVIHQGRWKLLIEPGWYQQTSQRPGTAYELYDLQSDPAETKNLASQFPEIVQKLAAECDAWQKRCGMVDYGQIIKANPSH